MVFWFVTSCAHVGVYTYTNVSEENIASIFRVLDIICSSGTWYIPTSPHNFTTQKTNISVFTFVDCTRASFGGHRRRDCPWLNPSSQGFAIKSSGQKRYSDCERYYIVCSFLYCILLHCINFAAVEIGVYSPWNNWFQNISSTWTLLFVRRYYIA
jgi:hypothetical protein